MGQSQVRRLLIINIGKDDFTMASETPDKTQTVGMSQLTKDRFDVTSKTVAIIGGIISAIILILTLNAGTEQRARELRWNQAKLATELMDEMLSDSQSFNALRMTDWENVDYQVDGKKVLISSQEVQDALDVKNNNNLPPNGFFIRESFDKLFYHMGKIERSLESNLLKFEDVRSPMDYYVPFLRSKYSKVLKSYMEQLHHKDAIKFMERFQS